LNVITSNHVAHALERLRIIDLVIPKDAELAEEAMATFCEEYAGIDEGGQRAFLAVVQPDGIMAFMLGVLACREAEGQV
jgi:hypothetical protein